MAEINQDFESVFLTYKDIRENNPTWSDRMIEDYLSLKRDVNTVATEASTTITNTEQVFDNGKSKVRLNSIERSIERLKQDQSDKKTRVRVNLTEKALKNTIQQLVAW